MEPATAETAKRSRKRCGREAVDGFLSCPACRQRTASATRKCVAKKRERGPCIRCTRPILIGYTSCHRCEIQNVFYARRRYDYRVDGHLYVASTPCGLKVGRSVDFGRRREELRRNYSGGRVELIEEYADKGHLEPFVHIVLNAYRVPGHRKSSPATWGPSGWRSAT